MKRHAKVNYDEGEEGEEENKRPRPRTHHCDRPLKEELRRSIMAKREAKGQQEIKVEFPDPEQSELTPEERLKIERRREQNRRAAQRSRQKKRMQESSHVQSHERLVAQNIELQREINHLRQQLAELRRRESQIRLLLATRETSWSSCTRDLLGPDARSTCMYRQSPRDEAAGGVTSDPTHGEHTFDDGRRTAPPPNPTPLSSSPPPGSHPYPGLVQLLSEAAPAQVVPSCPAAFTFGLTDLPTSPILDHSWTVADGAGLGRHRCMSGTSTISSDESEPSDYRLPCSSFSDVARVGSESSESCGGVHSEAVTAFGELDHSHGEVPDDDVFEAWGQHMDLNNNNPSFANNNNRVIPLDHNEHLLAQAADANELNINSVFDDVILPFDDELFNLNPNDPNFLMEFEG